MLLRYVKQLLVRVMSAARTEIAVVNTKKYCLCDIRILCVMYITKATDTHSECVILPAFPWQRC